MGNVKVTSATIQLKDQGGGVWGSKAPETFPLTYTGTPAQLGTITISTDGTYDFGTRSIPSQQWWQVGSRAWDKTGEVTLLEASRFDGDVMTAGVNADAFDVITNITARTGAKAGLRSGFAYESSLAGEEIGRFSVSPELTPTLTRKAFWGFTARWTDDVRKVFSSSYSSNTGLFSDGDNSEFVHGERFSGVKSAASGSTPFTGYIVKHDTGNGLVAFRVDDAYSYGTTDNNGAVITGDTSGATATFDGVIMEFNAAMKMTRSDTTPAVTPTSPEVALAFVHSGIPQFVLQERTSSTGTDDDRFSNVAMDSSEWEDWSWQADYSGASFVGESIRAGNATSETYSNPNGVDFSQVPYEMHHVLLCADWAGGSNAYGHLFARMKDPHMDYELNRVILGDSAILASCSATSVCRSESWTTTSTTERLNYGEIPSSTETFAFIFNGSGVCINATNGLSIGNAP